MGGKWIVRDEDWGLTVADESLGERCSAVMVLVPEDHRTYAEWAERLRAFMEQETAGQPG